MSGRSGRIGRGGRAQSGGQPQQSVDKVLTNVIPARLSNFVFYQYSVDCIDSEGKNVDSLSQRARLFHTGIDKLLTSKSEKERTSLKRSIVFAGSLFFSNRPIQELQVPTVLATAQGDQMTITDVQTFGAPVELSSPGATETQTIDQYRCGSCPSSFKDKQALLQHCRDSGHMVASSVEGTTPAPLETLVSYANLMLQRALSERYAKCCGAFVDLKPYKEEHGVVVYKAYQCNFGVGRNPTGLTKARLELTVDLKAKVVRNTSILDLVYGGKNRLDERERNAADRTWQHQDVIYDMTSK